MAGFSVISLRLKEMYQMITLGGDAELELVDTCDPFAEGILFQVRPPKKSWKNICNLSGGEKTLSSLALVFALHHYKPTPLYVMDEIDAALVRPVCLYNILIIHLLCAAFDSSRTFLSAPTRCVSCPPSHRLSPRTSRTCPSWRTTSRNVRRTRNSSSSVYGEQH